MRRTARPAPRSPACSGAGACCSRPVRAKYADLIERTLYNAVISGVSLDGRSVLLREHVEGAERSVRRRSAVGGRVAAAVVRYGVLPAERDAHALVPGSAGRDLGRRRGAAAVVCAGVGLRRSCPLGGLASMSRPQYPWHGTVRVRITSIARRRPGLLGLRFPAWAEGCTVAVNGVEQPTGPVGRSPPLRRYWAVGDEVVLELPVRARRTTPDDRIDSVRGCVAIERGPLVYCFEQLDQDVVLDSAAVVAGDLIEREQPDLLGGVTTIDVPTRDGQLDRDPLLRLGQPRSRPDDCVDRCPLVQAASRSATVRSVIRTSTQRPRRAARMAAYFRMPPATPTLRTSSLRT